MDHLIHDHEKRQRLWRNRNNGISEIDIINTKTVGNSNSNSNSAISQLLVQKMVSLFISVAAAWMTREGWLSKASNMFKKIGIITIIKILYYS